MDGPIVGDWDGANRSAIGAGSPQDVCRSVFVEVPREDEQVVRESVEIGDGCRVERSLLF